MASHAAESSWVPLACCSPPFPVKSHPLCLLGHSFPSVRQQPPLGPWKGSPFCNRSVLKKHQGRHLFLPPLGQTHQWLPIVLRETHSFSVEPGALARALPTLLTFITPHSSFRRYAHLRFPHLPWVASVQTPLCSDVSSLEKASVSSSGNSRLFSVALGTCVLCEFCHVIIHHDQKWDNLCTVHCLPQ